VSGDHRRLDDIDRLEAPLVCTCERPIPEHIGLFDAWQCARCLRKLHHTHQQGSPI